MDKYTIYCTEEQTRKALKLGAPISVTSEPLYNHPFCERDWVKVGVQGNSYSARIPTAEQMIGWFEEQRIFVHIDYDFSYDKPYKCEMCLFNGMTRHCGWFISRKEATLAAIDAALDYLEKR